MIIEFSKKSDTKQEPDAVVTQGMTTYKCSTILIDTVDEDDEDFKKKSEDDVSQVSATYNSKGLYY